MSAGWTSKLGTKKAPQELFMPWDTVASVQQKRMANAQQFTITGNGRQRGQFLLFHIFPPEESGADDRRAGGANDPETVSAGIGDQRSVSCRAKRSKALW
jgi:hypothetical protein